MKQSSVDPLEGHLFVVGWTSTPSWGKPGAFQTLVVLLFWRRPYRRPPQVSGSGPVPIHGEVQETATQTDSIKRWLKSAVDLRDQRASGLHHCSSAPHRAPSPTASHPGCHTKYYLCEADVLEVEKTNGRMTRWMATSSLWVGLVPYCGDGEVQETTVSCHG
ncbi:hypothetical protein XU18_0564 [Perkinsela sp. CCAP 1560/4]|nr:hypothetical protein XU18_0564 [Perkinsela sp. CCAP 1560/4]|eukprot:KNH09286.1 hypothetical protein XU18_0564 [Perkinsela sp. CCAP 1560/4]